MPQTGSSLIEGRVALIAVAPVLRPSCMSARTGTGGFPIAGNSADPPPGNLQPSGREIHA
jgi:hypothetical protein